jgi:hypothetical protein
MTIKTDPGRTSDVLTLTGIQKAVYAKGLAKDVMAKTGEVEPRTDVVDTLILLLDSAEALGINVEQLILARLK